MRKLLLFTAFLMACGSSSKEPVFPASIPPNWTRSAVHAIEASKFPPIIRDAGVKQAWQTEYQAADGGKARVDVYGIPPTMGLDLVQRWRPERDNAQLYTEHFLLNVAWEKAKRDEIGSLVRSLPKLIEGEK
jgi:hypothetical protein